jgi:hypothetical protein
VEVAKDVSLVGVLGPVGSDVALVPLIVRSFS